MSSFNANSFFNSIAAGNPQTPVFPYPGSQTSGGFNGPNLNAAQGAVSRAQRGFGQQGGQRWKPYNAGPGFGYRQPDVGMGPSQVPGARTANLGGGNRAMNDAAWNALFSNAVFGDMQNQQGLMNEQFNRLDQAMGGFGQQVTQGADRMRSVDARQRATMQGQAAGADQIGQQGYDDFIKYRDQQLAAVGKDIGKANEQAAQSVATYQQAIGEYKDRTALQAQNMAVGLQRQVDNMMKNVAMGINSDGTAMDPAQKAAMMSEMQRNTAEQTSMGINDIYTKYNDTMVAMKADLSKLQSAQSQGTLAGGQLRGQVGTAFGSQTLEAQQFRGSMKQLSSTILGSMEQMSAAAELGSVNLLVNGYKDMYEMIQGNKRGTTSLYAALSGWLAGMTTPGLRDISTPNFGSV